jgi:hypothetical protein
MKNTLLTLAAAFGLFGSLLVQADESGKSLFNGKDLTGWKAPEGNIWWIVEDGILKVRSGPDQKGSILWSEEEFTDFAVTLDFKFGEGIIDSGVHVKSQDQIQIGISGSLKRDMTAFPLHSGQRLSCRGRRRERASENG